MFEQLEPVSLPERAANALKDAFFSGQLKPGDAIVEREIARQMKVGTPVVREALISLQEQGFVRRVANTGTFVTQFNNEEVRQLYSLRIELEFLAFQWARARITPEEIAELRADVDDLVKAGEAGDRRRFLEQDYMFHRRCWQLSGNTYLYETLNRLMAPLFAFVVMASGAPLTGEMAREHYELVDALAGMEEPQFSETARRFLSGIASRWLSRMNPKEAVGELA